MKLILFILSACAATVLASPHNLHHARHQAVAARAAVANSNASLPLQRRQSNKRCKPRSSSSVAPSSTPAVNPSPARLNPKPTTSTTPYVEPKTTTPPAPAATSKPASTTQANTSNEPSFMFGTQSGQGTFFDVGLGACGITNVGTDYVVAVSHVLFDNYPGYNGVNPNTNPVCGRTLTATYQGKSVTVKVVDRCAADTCLVGNLDFSTSAFSQLAPFAVGRLFGMTWVWD